MDKRLIIGFISGILIIGCFLLVLPQTEVQAQASSPVQTDAATPINLMNNGNSWIHGVIMFEDQNGGGIDTGDGNKKTIYAEVYKKPDSTPLVMDLAQPAGKQLPAGTVLRMKVWVELLKPQVTATDTLSFSLNGSNIQPTEVNKEISNINLLPSSVTKDSVTYTTDSAQGSQLLQKFKPYYMEFILTFNEDGTVTKKLGDSSGKAGSVTITQVPTNELCSLYAGIG
jgi:hypothetical protein